MDELIKKYALELEKIYAQQTAGCYTFEGLLQEFAKLVLLHQEQENPVGRIDIVTDDNNVVKYRVTDHSSFTSTWLFTNMRAAIEWLVIEYNLDHPANKAVLRY